MYPMFLFYLLEERDTDAAQYVDMSPEEWEFRRLHDPANCYSSVHIYNTIKREEFYAHQRLVQPGGKLVVRIKELFIKDAEQEKLYRETIPLQPGFKHWLPQSTPSTKEVS